MRIDTLLTFLLSRSSKHLKIKSIRIIELLSKLLEGMTECYHTTILGIRVVVCRKKSSATIRSKSVLNNSSVVHEAQLASTTGIERICRYAG